uniref:Uncharacterized protein n=1 Tax=Kalanchoe fedtschenkoi TaxID=63787 RepID=A0A7N0V4C9_KALFE
MSYQGQTFFLEEWLRASIIGNSGSPGSSSSVSSNQSPLTSARAIIQAWSELRECSQTQSFKPHHLQALNALVESRASLFVSDPQARLLISILGSQSSELGEAGHLFILKLLYVWARKSSRPSAEVVGLAVEAFRVQFEKLGSQSPLLSAEFMLVLGAVCYIPSLGNESRAVCLDMACKLLDGFEVVKCVEDVVPIVLAGVGYCLASADAMSHFGRLLDFALGVWGKAGCGWPAGNAAFGLMILHLVEWLLFGFFSSSYLEKVNMFGREVFDGGKRIRAEFSSVMAYAGVLRACHKALAIGLRLEVTSKLRMLAENGIEAIARRVNGGCATRTGAENDLSSRLLLQCIALALARSGTVSSRPTLLICLASALLMEIFPLRRLYSIVFKSLIVGSVGSSVHELVKEHLASVLFKEAGAVTGVFCHQYISADHESKQLVENLVWSYCHDIYSGHRRVALFLRGEMKDLLGDLEKIAESNFLMVVVFSLTVTKQWVNSNISANTRMDTSVEILVSLSCLEYFRRIRLPEYMETIRAVIISVQENEAACVRFLESMPPYADLTRPQDFTFLRDKRYAWSDDEVQTARILFYMRVVPTCVEQLPAQVFKKTIAPTMFLYLKHPSEKVARASHSVFVAFMSSRKDSETEDKESLKEQLVFYYIQRSLEAYPGLTPFDGLASGVVALVRFLPAGSPAIFYAIHSLVLKANELCFDPSSQDAVLGNSLEESGPGRKIMDLLLRLIFVVDIQVLPDLMKQLAQTIVQLPRDGRTATMNELFAQVAESDDVVRKPVLVSWLQSLSYICSQDASKIPPSKRQGSLKILTSDPESRDSLSARL